MPQHTVIATIHDRPGTVARTLQHLAAAEFRVATLSVGRSRELGISRVTMAVDARHASSLVQRLGAWVDVIAVTDASLALRLTPQSRGETVGDFREQADGAPYEHAA